MDYDGGLSDNISSQYAKYIHKCIKFGHGVGDTSQPSSNPITQTEPCDS